MPVFSYTAKDLKGNYHKGEVETADEHQAAVILRRKSLIVISLKSSSEKGGSFFKQFFFRVSFNEVVIMTRQLATMIQAGLVLSEALDILEEQQANSKMKLVLRDVSTDIKGGIDFASALEKHPEVFPKLYVQLVRAGQASGKLDTVLLELASNLEKQRDFQSKVKGAMIYPAVILVMMLTVMMIMMFVVIPQLTKMFSDAQMQLPLPTKIVIAIASFLINFWWLLLIGVAGLIYGAKKFLSTPTGRLIYDNFMITFPVVGNISRLVIMTNFTRTLGLLVAAGIPIIDAIKIVSDVVGNSVYKKGLLETCKGVERGLTFSSQLLALPLFPRIVGQMIKTGEETGKLDDIMYRLADYFESEADNILKNSTALVEPITLVILGAGVGFLVVSIILPIYQLSTNIK